MSTKLKSVVKRTFYRKGIVILEERCRNGNLHGKLRKWHRNGQLAEEDSYCHGLRHGLCRQWSDRGRLLGSFHMAHGTGGQQTWYDNGQLKVEFITVAGQFCGRSRRWLRDGTLITDEVLLFNRQVTPDVYRQAAAKDARLPKLRGRIAKLPVNDPAWEQKSFLLHVSWLLAKRNGNEVRAWLKAEDKTKRGLGRFKRKSLAAAFVEELYQAGAVKVIAPDIYHNQRGDQFADCLLVQLPNASAKRKAIRKVCAQLRKDDLRAIMPEKDWGEAHLYIQMG